MMNFGHPEYLHFLWGLPLFFLIYGLIRMHRNKKLIRQGKPLPSDKENKIFTISIGWVICTISALVYAIIILGLSHPKQTDEKIKEQESSEIEMMLVLDASNAIGNGNSQIEQAKSKLIQELSSQDIDSTHVSIGALSYNDLCTINTKSKDFSKTQKFLSGLAMYPDTSANYIATAISKCAEEVKWAKVNTKHAIVLFSSWNDLPADSASAARDAAKKAGKKGIFTYVVGLGANADKENFTAVAQAGKGLYLPAEASQISMDAIISAVKMNDKLSFIDVLNYFLLTLVFFLTPSLVIYMCNKYSWMGKIGPIIFLYGIGMLLGNLKVNGAGLFPDQIKTMQNFLSDAMVPLAIPLMLFSCTLNKKEIGKHFKAMILGIIGVVGAVITGYFICKDHLPEANKIAGMLTGVYTGGTINLAAIKESVGGSKETYILMQTYDIIICLSYLFFLMLGGIALFRKFLPNLTNQPARNHKKDRILSAAEEEEQMKLQKELLVEEQGFLSILTRKGLKNSLVLFGFTILGIVLSAGLTLLIFGGELNMAVFFLLLTTFGIIGSFFKQIHDRKENYNLGLYAIYIFSLVIATVADFDQLVTAITTDFWLPGFMLISVFGSLILTALLAKIFKLDADTMVITSVTYINSPAFVPMIASSMHNKNVLIPGLTIGVIGFAVGNYLGTTIAFLL